MKTILIIDHVASQRELLVTWLKDDYAVCTAADGATGMALAAQTEPDLIFIALALPDSEGGEVARCIKAQVRLRDIPLIALTDPTMSGADAQGRAAGWADALRTPLDEEQVSAILRKWLGGG
ncbi:MAG TPA: response regulator [Candidatus Tectomicrobia bacterium]